MDKPNIIIIFCDDLGYGDIGCFGSEVNRTPVLDRMAEEGIRFTDFYVPSPVCSPSRAGLMTGCYPKRVGLDSGYDFSVLLPADPIGLHPDEITIADVLKSAGYATKMLGKWHLGDQSGFLPTDHGFDSYFGLPYSNDHYAGRPAEKRTHLPERFSQHRFNPMPLMRDDQVAELEPDQTFLTKRYTEEAVSFIRENKDQPFFVYFAHLYVHTPLFPPKEFLDKAENGPYGAEVECIDWSAGVILDTLKELGIDDNTLVIFTSDNGSTARMGGSNAPLRGTKATTWEGGMREPCIMRWPAAIPAGGVSHEVVSSMDFLPTMAKLAGVDAPDDRVIDGHDIRPLMFGEDNARSPYDAFFYYGTRNHELQAVRSGKWKLHLIANELYDLESDIGEQHDVFARRPDVVIRLAALADACRYDLGDACTGIEGANTRPVGRVDNPRPLTNLDEMSTNVRALYDIDDTVGIDYAR
ncbi:MAG: sulfatase [SAR202 cluster bacterium]|nr:sulfatase [SAR202 cluster bacterium]